MTVMEQRPLDALITPEQWRLERGERFFASATSWNWYLRKHRSRLVELGVLVRIAGRNYINAERIELAIIEIGAH